MKKIILLLVLVILLGGAAYYISRPTAPGQSVAEDTAVSVYSLDGQVISISGDTINVSVGRVEKTPEGDKFLTSEKVWTLAPKLSFVEGKSVNTIDASTLSARLGAKDRAIFSGSGTSPWSGGLFTIDKIEIISRAAVPSTLPKNAPVVR